MAKLRVGLLFGGRSTEHEVSVTSATTVFQGMDPARYAPVLVGVDPDGAWRVAEPEQQLLPESVFREGRALRCAPSLGAGLELLREGGDPARTGPIDVFFPIIHGRDGEDGSLQGLLQMARVPFVGADVKSTALCMDKTLAKRVLRDAGLPVVASVETRAAALRDNEGAYLDAVEGAFPYPVFAKPTNTGSSVGVSKAHSRDELQLGLKDAARYDTDVLVEPAIDAREIECAVLGGAEPAASVLGEILYAAEFYDYEAKYASDDTQLAIPAELEAAQAEELRDLALRAFCALKCWGMARVDFFLDRASGRAYINELNTHPGFTDGSMYPLLWERSGIALPELIDRLIELALERQRAWDALDVRFSPPR